MPTDLTDTEVLAELSEDERFWFPSDGSWAIPHGNCMLREHDWLRRLALARRQLREAEARASGRTMFDAAAVEREACAAMVDDEAELFRSSSKPWDTCSHEDNLDALAARIRAQGGTGNG